MTKSYEHTVDERRILRAVSTMPGGGLQELQIAADLLRGRKYGAQQPLKMAGVGYYLETLSDFLGKTFREKDDLEKRLERAEGDLKIVRAAFRIVTKKEVK